MAESLHPVYLIAGTDRPKVDRAVQRLRARFDGDAVELLDASVTSGEDAVAACNALGLFAGGGRLVVLEGVDGWKAADVKAVAEYLKSPTPETTLALVGSALKKDAPIARAVASHGELLMWDVPKGLQGWVAEQFKLQGASVDADACRRLLELVGDDLYELAAEVDRIATWAGKDELILDETVDMLVAPRAQSPAFELTDAWGSRDVAGVLRASERMLERTGDPRARTIPRVVGSLTNHVTRIRACQELDAEGVPSKEAATRLKMHPFYVQKLYAQARNYSAEELGNVTIRLAELDHALKGGSRLATDLELERALVDITQRAERVRV